MQPDPTLADLLTRIEQVNPAPHRRVIAVAGPPASGKSTFADTLVRAMNATNGHAAVVPMDGFHLDNRLLDEDGQRARKGAPETFDAAGLMRLVNALQSGDDVIYPIFDRARDIAIAGAGRIAAQCETVVIEGNYLLHDAPVWRDLCQHWSLSIALTPPRALLRARLVARWLEHGFSPEDAGARADQNDMKNADLVLEHMLPADLTLREASE